MKRPTYSQAEGGSLANWWARYSPSRTSLRGTGRPFDVCPTGCALLPLTGLGLELEVKETPQPERQPQLGRLVPARPHQDGEHDKKQRHEGCDDQVHGLSQKRSGR